MWRGKSIMKCFAPHACIFGCRYSLHNDKGEKYILSEITTEQKMKYNNTVTSVVLLYSGKPLIQLSSGWWYYVLILIVMCRYSHWPLKQLSTALFKNISGFRVHKFCMLTYEDNSQS